MRRNDTCIPRTFLRKAFAHPSSINFSRYPIAVTVAECSHVLFLLPKGGVQVVRGQVYSIVLNSDHNVFYETRAAAQPISPHQVGDVSKALAACARREACERAIWLPLHPIARPSPSSGGHINRHTFFRLARTINSLALAPGAAMLLKVMLNC